MSLLVFLGGVSGEMEMEKWSLTFSCGREKEVCDGLVFDRLSRIECFCEHSGVMVTKCGETSAA